LTEQPFFIHPVISIANYLEKTCLSTGRNYVGLETTYTEYFQAQDSVYKSIKWFSEYCRLRACNSYQ